MSQSVYAVATMDTKGHELAYVAERLRAAGVAVVTVDVGTMEPPVVAADVDRDDGRRLSSHERAAGPPRCLRSRPRPGDHGDGRGAGVLPRASEYEAGRVAGVIGIGGSGGTALITPAMRALPIGLPKLMVSTVASGNTAPYVGSSDITHDVLGRRRRRHQRRLAPGARQRRRTPWPAWSSITIPPTTEKPTLGMTMFGVTTPCVTAVREALEARGFDCLVFHATGTGGRAMEKLVEAGLIQGVLDITTTEVADEVVGGILPAGPHRFEAILAGQDPLRAQPRRPRHGQLRGHRHRARAVPQPPASRPQRPGDAHADDARGESPVRPLDRRQAQPSGSPVPDPDPGGRRLRARCARTAVPRPGGRRRTLRRAGVGRSSRPRAARSAACRCTSTIPRSPGRWSIPTWSLDRAPRARTESPR